MERVQFRVIAIKCLAASTALLAGCLDGGKANTNIPPTTVGAGSNTPASCTFNAQTITSGNSVTAYQAASVPGGQTCTSETRTCTNGTLSGSYGFSACSVSGTHITINLIFDSSVTGDPNSAQIQATANRAKAVLEAKILNPITVTIQMGWGKINGLPVSSLGESMYYAAAPFTSDQIKTAMLSTSLTAIDATAYAHLPATPAGGATGCWMSYPNAAALGIYPDNGNTIIGWVGFGSGFGWTFDDTGGVVAGGTYDLEGTMLHELSEVLGRFTGAPGTDDCTPLDFFRYASPGVMGNAAEADYFSIDGGVTNLASYNTNSGGDLGDLAGADPSDCTNAYGSSGIVAGFKAVDWTQMDVIGYDVAP